VRSVGVGVEEMDLHDPERGLPGGDHAHMRYTKVGGWVGGWMFGWVGGWVVGACGGRRVGGRAGDSVTWRDLVCCVIYDVT
jgi:hypothetical protein